MGKSIKARTRYCFVGGDFSAQEPRVFAHLSHEDTLIDTFLHNRDPYATIAQTLFHKDYWDCMEHHEDGTPNPDGKALRKKAKTLMLGILYGMGAKLMSENMKVTVEEGREILDNFFKEFPRVKEFVAANEADAKTRGYVEDYMGRIRHLPDAMLEEVEVNATKKVLTEASVFPDFTGDAFLDDIPDEALTRLWTEKYYDFCEKEKRFDAKNKFKELAKKNGIGVKDNGAFISKCMTQCTNSRIQGSASTLTKKAMVNIYNDPIMKELGFRILIPIHDELLGEVPIVNAEKAEKRLTELMIAAGKPECSVAMKCDTYVVKHWYADEIYAQVHDTYQQLLAGNEKKNISPMTSEEAYEKLCADYPELLPKTVREMCDGTFDVLEDEV